MPPILLRADNPMKLSLDSPMCVRFASIAGPAIILLRVWRIWAAGGLFFTLGLDYAIYGAAAEAVTQSGWSSLYDMEANTRAFAGWISEEAEGRIDPSRYVACPYPAPFLVPFFATNLLSHGGGFVAWTVLNILAYASIVRGLTRGCERSGPLMSLAPYAFFPFLWTLYLGQLVIVMAFGLYRALRAFEQGRELAAGCWLGVLLLKPQFALILGLVLLGKRRWAALGGLALVAAGMAASTFALVGLDGVRGFLGILRSFSGFRRVPDIVNPLDMINFRGALVHLLPETWSEEQGTRAVLALSVAITLGLVPIWRGPWDPRGGRFPRQVLATMIVALFASFHTHIHAATLLIVPILAALRPRRDPDPLVNLSALLIFLPTFSVAFDGILEHCAWILMALMALTLGVILVDSLRSPREALLRVARPRPMARSTAAAYNGRV
jgi:hypothetical protein